VVSLVGDFNPGTAGCTMRTMGASGIWELSCPVVGEGAHYKYEIRGADGSLELHADPYAQRTEVPPATASLVFRPHHDWADQAWMNRTRRAALWRSAVSIYEVHLAPGGACRRSIYGR